MKHTVIGLFSALLLGTLGFSQTAPELISYQGFLTDSNGDALGNSGAISRKVIFALYDTDSGGDPVWGEEHTVTIVDGRFSILLGQGIDVTGTFFPNGNPPRNLLSESLKGAKKYLEIIVDEGGNQFDNGDVAISPRQRLTSSAYALRAIATDYVGVDSVKQPAKVGNPVEYPPGGYIEYNPAGVSPQTTFSNNNGANPHDAFQWENIEQDGTRSPLMRLWGSSPTTNAPKLDIYGSIQTTEDIITRNLTAVGNLNVAGTFTSTNSQFSVDGTGNTTTGGNLHVNGNVTYTGSLQIPGDISTNNIGINGQNSIEFGADNINKEGNNGKIAYQAYTPGLDIVGAGTNVNDRLVTIHGNLNASGLVHAASGLRVNGGGDVHLNAGNDGGFKMGWNHDPGDGSSVLANHIGLGNTGGFEWREYENGGAWRHNENLMTLSRDGYLNTRGDVNANHIHSRNGMYVTSTMDANHINSRNGMYAAGSIDVNDVTARSAVYAGQGIRIGAAGLHDIAVQGLTMTWNRHGLGASNFVNRRGSGGWGGFRWYAETNVGSAHIEEIMTISPGGHLITDGAMTPNSDRRLKEDIEILDYGLEEILALKPARYQFIGKEADLDSVGFIAQEVREVMPELIFEGIDEQKTLSMNYDGVVPVLVNAVKEQQAEILALKSKQATLEERLAKLEALLKE